MSLKRMVNLTTSVSSTGEGITLPYLPPRHFRGLPQPEAHGRIKFNDTVQ
ncbi:hypothetical protein HTS61_24275 [Escherichia coli]|nr:hypothetical protein [Escherichia coli]